MQHRSKPLDPGQPAPEFALRTANNTPGRDVGSELAFRELIARGPVIVEFLRGTW